MSNTRRPSSLDSIKRLAKAIKAQKGIAHRGALEAAAKQAGYQNYTHARRQLETGAEIPTPIGAFPENPRQGPTGDPTTFLDQCRQAWIQTLDQLNPGRQARLAWEGPGAIQRVLEPVLAHTRSHAHLPTGGGLDFSDVRASAEPGCIEFQLYPSAAYIARPKTLILERLA